MNGRPIRRLPAAAATALLVATVTILGQEPAARQVPYENQKAEIQGVKVTITYDLVSSDPANEVFTVALQVRIKSTGELVPVSPSSVTGDGVGSNLIAGKQKKIVWNAGLDVEVPQFDLYDFLLVVTAGPPTGQLSVESDPAGAKVTIDDESQARGVTPLTIEGLTPGSHKVLVSKDGYQPNPRDGQVEAFKTTPLSVTLTQVPVAPTNPLTPQGRGGPPVVPPKGGIPKWIIPVAGGGAAAALLGLKGKGTSSGNGGTSTLCTSFSLSSISYTPPPTGGSSPAVIVTGGQGGCTSQWSAIVDPSSIGYVHVVPASGNPGQSTVVTVDANGPELGTPNRTGSATIGGVVFTINAQSNQINYQPASVGASEASGSAIFLAVPGVIVVQGQKLTIATGSTQIFVGTIGTSVPPTGSGTGNGGSQARLPFVAKHALICGIGVPPDGQTVGELFYAGPGSLYTTGAPAPASGSLFCGMNAPDLAGFTGNSGAWTVTVTVGG